MKISRNWLSDFISSNKSDNDLVNLFTQLGLECTVEHLNFEFNNVVVGNVLTCNNHPNADKLKLCEVSLGNSKTIKVVCGAENARDGLISVYAAPGSIIPKTKMKLKGAKIRGVESHGMLCSESELNISDESDGIIEFQEKARIGDLYQVFIHPKK